MNEIILAKYGELALKGQNRSAFESAMLKTIRKRVEYCGDFKVYKAQSTVYIEPLNESADIDKAAELLARVFGLAALNRAAIAKKELGDIERTAASYLKDKLESAKTFRVSAKRADKSFALNSMELAGEVGAYLLESYPHLKVSMDKPDVNVVVEVRDYAAYVHAGKLEAAGGMPSGTSGRAAVMLSGGIDSPVAAYMMAKRGLDLVGVHFVSPPYTSDRALQKVVDLSAVLSGWLGNLALLVVPFTEIQMAIAQHCPDALFTVLMRRSMVRITERICKIEHCDAMVTGESLAQVASQTLQAIQCTDAASTIPILRPLIGMDKTEIVDISRKIGTYDLSILPYEDCCTVFTPRHPKTKPRLEDVEKAEQNFDIFSLEEKAAASFTVKMQHFFDEL